MILTTDEKRVLRRLIVSQDDLDSGFNRGAYTGLGNHSSDFYHPDVQLAWLMTQQGLCENGYGQCSYRLTTKGRKALRCGKYKRIDYSLDDNGDSHGITPGDGRHINVR